MSENKLTAEPRSTFGKGPARQLRREHKVPAVIYGHGTEPEHVALPGHATMLALKVSNALLTIDIAGDERLALPKDIQRDPIRGTIKHVDLLIVRRGEKVTVDIQVRVEGEAAPGSMVNAEATSVQLEVDATQIPDSLTIDISGAEPGTQFTASQLPLPDGAVLITDGDVLIVNVVDENAGVNVDDEEPTGEDEAPAEGDAPATEG